MTARWKNLKRPTKAALIVVGLLMLFTVIAYAAGWLTKPFRIPVDHGPIPLSI